MLKKTTVIIILAAVLTAVLASCAKLPTYVMYTGGERGTYYNLGNSISDLFKEDEDTSGERDKSKFRADIQVRSSSGYKQNIEALISGEASLAIVRNDIAYSALNGTGCYSGEAVGGFCAIAHLYREAVYIIATEDITDVSMLSGKRISVGEEGSANEIIAQQILSACKIKDYEKKNMNVAGTAEAYKNGEIDAFIVISGIPSSTVKNLSSESKLTVLSLGQTVVDAICEQYPYFSPCTVGKKNYSVLKSDVKTVSLYATLLASSDIDSEIAYNMAKRLAEDTFLMLHDKSDEIQPAKMWEDCCVALHEGAEKYFKEYTKKEQAKNTTSKTETSSPDESTASVTAPDPDITEE